MSALTPKADMCGATNDVCYGPIADIPETVLSKQKDRLAAVFENLTRLFLSSGLNNWRFALANRSLAFTYATGKAQGENHGADYD